MSKIKNLRIERKTQNINKKPQHTENKNNAVKNEISAWKTKIKNIPTSRKIFYLCLILIDIIAITITGCLFAGMKQSLVLVTLFVLNLIAVAILYKPVQLIKLDILKTIALFSAILLLSSAGFSLYSKIGFDQFFMVNQEINNAKKGSQLLFSTDMVDIYINTNEKRIYSISNINGQKYVNQNQWSESEMSEYYDFYTIGIFYSSPVKEITELCLYPPSPYTTTGYDYLVEFIYNKQRYVTKVFIPGMVEFNHKASANVFTLTYKNNSDKYYSVNRIDQYLLFQNPYSTFATPFRNVKYTSNNEYFFVRYNRYLKTFAENSNEEIQEITEDNVKFLNSFSVMSATIEKVNFFWVGDVINDEFSAAFPVIEIVYKNGTSDIAVIKDIDAANISSAIT